MFDFGILSYSAGAIAFLLLCVLLVVTWQKRQTDGILLLAVSVLTCLWLASITYQLKTGELSPSVYHVLEILRDLGWFSFLFNLLGYRTLPGSDKPHSLNRWAVGVYVLGGLMLASVLSDNFQGIGEEFLMSSSRIASLGFLLFSVIGLVLVEQLFRNTNPNNRWFIKFLCIGVGGSFAYDFYMYADALLFQRLDPELWSARGAINAMIVPFLAVSVARNKDWSVSFFASKRIVFHSAALLASGVYLIIMAVVGYYIRDYGGTWGLALQSIFLFGSLAILVVLMFSGQVRAQLKFFLNRHFFHYKYDYREEWLRLISTLSSSSAAEETRQNVILAISEIVESTGGLLWVKEEPTYYSLVARYAFPEPDISQEPVGSSLARFLQYRELVIDLQEVDREPEVYAGLDLPEWLRNLSAAWLVVPLFQNENLLGFVVLAKSRGNFVFNWEDIDLLKTIGRQAASYLALLMATEKLGEAKQFETFTRLSAYVVHDLKNMVAQLSLVVSNAKKHMHNPEFVEDAINTVDNTVGRMNRLLEQLRKDRAHHSLPEQYVDLCNEVERVVELRSVQLPRPKVLCDESACGLHIHTDKERLLTIMEHLVQNAQEATKDDGEVTIILKKRDRHAVVEVIDNGIGMDEGFIRNRLYRPFDTTKGNAGMGVGAYESREFVREQGGEMLVKSVPDEGTCFTIRLPLPKPAEAGRAEDQLAPNPG